jgi:hypothetical protein
MPHWDLRWVFREFEYELSGRDFSLEHGKEGLHGGRSESDKGCRLSATSCDRTGGSLAAFSYAV